MASVKITAIETILDPQRPLLVWVRVHTDAGLVGLGETFQSPDAVARVIHGTLAKVLIGADPTQIELLWHHMFNFAGTTRESDNLEKQRQKRTLAESAVAVFSAIVRRVGNTVAT